MPNIDFDSNSFNLLNLFYFDNQIKTILIK